MRDWSAGAFDPQGPVADTMAGLWWLMLGLGTAVFLLVAALLVGGLFRRRRDGADPGGGPHPDRADAGAGAGSTADGSANDGAAVERRRTGRWLVAGGVAMPLVLLIVVFGATVAAMRDVPDEVPDGALVVELTGHQWWWEVRYPEEGITTANEVHLPVGRPVAFRLTSVDVIHSFWVPALGGKTDLLPDGVNTMVLRADQPGTHRSLCAEFCGLQHARHGLRVVAEPTADFDAWVAGQQRPATEPTDAEGRAGRDAFAAAGCATCHAIAGTDAAGRRGPDLTHLASRAELGAGTLANTRADLLAWVADPHSAKSGVAMPAADLPDAELTALVAYLEGLR